MTTGAEKQDHPREEESVSEVEALLTRHGVERPEPQPMEWYEARETGLWRVTIRQGADGEERRQDRLTNFTAKIIAATEVDDGVDVERHLTVEAVVGGRTRTCTVGAAAFTRMEWVVPELGPLAVVEATRGARDHARAAIQTLSDPAEVRVFGQTGWRQVGGAWVYLHKGGAIGAQGPVEGVEVELGSLGGYTLLAPGDATTVRWGLRMLEVAPDRITLPLLMLAVRAPLGRVDFAVALYGSTGLGKSEIAALAQQFFGPEMDARSLPASWSATANSLEEMAFRLADAVLAVDDFCPAGSPRDVEALNAKADRLIRNTGNGAARGRMNRDGSLRAARPPRAAVLSTGEEQPRGQSLRARTLPLGLRVGETDWDALTVAQGDAAGGVYAAGMAAYLRWLAPRLDDLRAERPQRLAALRSEATRESAHRRTATAVASLAWGWEVWLRFAVDYSAVTQEEADALRSRGWASLLEAGVAAEASVGETDPAKRFLDLLSSAVGRGLAHVATRKGGCPAREPEAWGWRLREHAQVDVGQRIGWVEGDDLWLDPEASYAVARAAGEGLALDGEALRDRLGEAGHLVTQEAGRRTVRVRVEGRQRRVLHLRVDALGGGGE